MDYVIGNSNKLQKLGLEEKMSWAFNVFTLGSNETSDTNSLWKWLKQTRNFLNPKNDPKTKLEVPFLVHLLRKKGQNWEWRLPLACSCKLPPGY